MKYKSVTCSVTAEELMEQAQTYASTWASVGGPFDDGNTLARAEKEKAEFWSLVKRLVQERDDYRTAEEHQIALRQKALEREQTLASDIESLREKANLAVISYYGIVGNSCWNNNDRTAFEALGTLLSQTPATSPARRDAVSRASGAAEFVSWLANECESNGEVGEIFGMTLSSFTGDSRAAPNLRAARAVFAEAKKLAEWKLEQVEGGQE